MDRRIFILMIVVLIMAFMIGYINSYTTGIQPGYFEKAEAPAYGVGGGESLAAGMDEKFQAHLKTLYQEDKE